MKPHAGIQSLVKKLPGSEWLRSMLIGTEENQWLRRVMNEETQKLVAALEVSSLRVLEISGSAWSGRFPFRSYRSAVYPDFDICAKPLPEQFDLIIAEQVWEHLAYPHRATRHVYEMLPPGGHFLVTTPFLVRFHPQPLDCTRWTAEGLKCFLEEGGFAREKIQSFSWGNRACAEANFHLWRRYLPFWHSLKNEPFYPCVVWALAAK